MVLSMVGLTKDLALLLRAATFVFWEEPLGVTSVPFFLDCRALGRHPAPELEPCLSELASQVCSRCTIQISPIHSPPNVQVIFLLGIKISIFLNRKKGPNKNIPLQDHHFRFACMKSQLV